MRELTMEEMQQVAGGLSLSDFKTVWDWSQEAGDKIYDSLDTETQDAIGGTIDMMLINTGLKEV